MMILLASLTGAALFFVAGCALMALRNRDALATAEQTLRAQAQFIEEHKNVFETEDPTTVMRDAKLIHQVAALRDEASGLRRDLERAQREAAAAQDLRGELERIQKEATTTSSASSELRRVADDRAKQLDKARTDAVAATTELKQLQSKLRDVERLLGEKSAAARDLSTENEQLKGRLRDAEALRSEYVRLRTATTDSEFLKSEIARLEKELHASRVTALGAKPKPRAARGSQREITQVQRSIGESLARVIEKFADAGTRSSAIADRQGFPLASSGTDGNALAAYAAHLFASASRAKEFLPVGAPGSIEIVDTSGVRISLWSFEVDAERLMLANLAVSPVDVNRVESTLGDLAQILAPSPSGATATP
jgi:predicted regulator of Ras-like GTPase activity (Roadblock/LC7/MglB family)